MTWISDICFDVGISSGESRGNTWQSLDLAGKRAREANTYSPHSSPGTHSSGWFCLATSIRGHNLRE